MDDQAFLVARRCGTAEETAFLFVRASNVFEAPRRPKLLRHDGAAYGAIRRNAC